MRATMKRNKTMRATEVGTFEVESGEVRVSDPCYEIDTWCAGTLENVKKGTWIAKVIHSGGRCAILVAHHKDNPIKYDSDKFIAEGFEVGVDSGQAGIFDQEYFKNDEIVKGVKRIGKKKDQICVDEPWYSVCCDRTLQKTGAGVIPFGCVSSSGWGDGGYECSTVKTNDEITAIKIDFAILEDEIWDDEEDEDEDEDWGEDE